MTFNSKFKLGAAISGAVLAIGAFAGQVSAGTLATWDLTANASSPNGLAAGTLTAPAIAAGLYQNGTVSGNSASYSYDSKGFVAGAQGDNVDARLTVSSATQVTDLVFSAFASNTGPGLVDVYYSADGSALVSDGTLTIGTATGASAPNFDVAFSNLTINSSLNVYFSADANGVSANGGALGSGGTLRLNNVSDSSSTPLAFEGSAAVAVPAPAAIPATLAGTLLVGATALIRRRRIA